MTDFTLSDLEAVVADRAAAPPDQSYTAQAPCRRAGKAR